jgi:hypothetical protein
MQLECNILAQMPSKYYYRMASNTDTLCLTNNASFATIAQGADNNDTILTTTLLLLGNTFGNSLTDYDARPQVGSPALNHSCWSWNTSFVGVEEEDEVYGLSLYPNPTDGFTNLSFDAKTDGEMNIQVIDLTGKIVRSVKSIAYETGKNNYTLDVQGLATGVYVVNVNMGTTLYTQKLVVR